MSDIRLPRWVIALLLIVSLPLVAAAQPGLPGAPTNLQVNVSGNTLTITWGPPSTGGAPTNYQLIARTPTGTVIAMQNVWPTPSITAAVPNGTYVISVQAQNAVGFGPETTPQTVTVPSGPPSGPGAPGPPTGLQATVSGNTLNVSWGAPVSGGAPTNYVLIARTQAGAELARLNAWPTPSFVGTVPNGIYVLTVQASNASGPGPESSPVTVTAPATAPPGPGVPGAPTSFQSTVSGNTLSLAWGPPTTGGTVTSYSVIARTTAGALIVNQNVGNTTSFVGAVPNGVYVLTVQALGSSGPGPQTAPRTITVPSTTQLPGAPRNLSASATGSTITLGWTAPAAGAGPVDTYVIRASTTAGGPTAATFTVPSSTTQTTVPGAPGGTFHFTVIATNAAGSSPPSNNASVTVGPPSTSRSTLNPPGVPASIQAWGSQIYGSGESPYKAFDDFTFTAGSAIRQVQWQGIYCVSQDGSAAPPAVASSFVISIHPDQSGRPNMTTPLATVTVSAAQVNQTFQGNFSNATCSGATNTTWSLYSYSTVLPSAFTAAPGVKYWLSVQAVTPSAAVEWGWRSGTNDTRSTVSLYRGEIFVTTLDRAFALSP